MRFKGLASFACLVALVTAGSQAAEPGSDFWYVVPGGVAEATTSTWVNGIVIPSSVDPIVQTTLGGSVVSWDRPDGTTQSLAVQGVSSLAFKPGPLKGTTLIPFVDARRLRSDPGYDPRSCCACASWQNSRESVEALSCVVGCAGCGCEGCICSPTFPCPMGPESAFTLKPHDSAAPMMTIGGSGAADGITVFNEGKPGARFRGERLGAGVSRDGQPVITDPDTITLDGPVKTNSTTRGDKALFAWSSAHAAVIVEQPRAMARPSFGGGTIDFRSVSRAAPGTATDSLKFAPVMDRCSACGTHPNSDGDLEIYDCVPGTAVCYRCVSWECYSPES